MWLVHAETRTLYQFHTDDTRMVVYAILSHVWGKEELTFQELRSGRPPPRKEGTRKLEQLCKRALADGYKWVWMDTCCIDKTSSAELSEAINSMYKWYREAARCYVYLADVPMREGAEEPGADGSRFRRSRWFTRGWTLQELLSPENILFVGLRRRVIVDEQGKKTLLETWEDIGTKSGLAEVIEEITGIDVGVLLGKVLLDDVSIAKRMSWASKRETTRVEDRAYSLMGIFNVNMPTIYGEGDMAFIRLQMEILKNTTDQSIFAWGTLFEYRDLMPALTEAKATPGSRWVADFRCLLARSPEPFQHAQMITSMSISSLAEHLSISILAPEYYPTNFGLHIHLPVHDLDLKDKNMGGLALGVLPCRHRGGLLALLLQREPNTTSRYRVGMFALGQEMAPQAHHHPLYRLCRVPVDVAHSWEMKEASLAYILSHNANPHRSIEIGKADGRVTVTGIPTPPTTPLEAHVFVIAAENGGYPGWAPYGGGGGALAITIPLVRDHHSLAIFRNEATGEAFVLVIGLAEPTDMRAVVYIKQGDAEYMKKWEVPDDVLVKTAWRLWQKRLSGTAESDREFRVEGWADGAYSRGVRPNESIVGTLSAVRLVISRSQLTIQDAKRVYSVGLQLGDVMTRAD